MTARKEIFPGTVGVAAAAVGILTDIGREELLDAVESRCAFEALRCSDTTSP